VTVTLVPADLIVPYGRLDPALFPAGNLDVLLPGWLEVATIKVEGNPAIAESSHNDAAEAYVYHLAYSYLAGQMIAMPASVSEGDGAISVDYSDGAWKYYRDLALSWLDIYNGLSDGPRLVKPLIFEVS
jgi:hypothetical protein